MREIKCNLKKILIDKKMSAKELAGLTGIAESTLSKLSNNQTTGIRFDVMNKIIGTLEITPNDLFDMKIKKSSG